MLNGCQAGLHAGRIGGGGGPGGGATQASADALAAAADTSGAFSLAGASAAMRWVWNATGAACLITGLFQPAARV